MTRSTPGYALILVALAALSVCHGAGIPVEKVSPAVLHSTADFPKMRVLILGNTQLLAMPNGFEAFCRANAGHKRLNLRKEVIAKLKAIADKEQPTILKALGNPKDAVRLWIINAVVVTLPRDKIFEVARIKEVKYLYANGNGPRIRASAKRVGKVLKPKKPRPFTTEGKKIPWNLEGIGAPRVWKELGVTGEGVVVAMYDAGVNYLHADLQRNIWLNTDEDPRNGKDDDGNGYVDDYYGYDFTMRSPEVIAKGQRQHGTMTSGIVAGDGTGGTLTGVAPRAKLMILKAWGGIDTAALAHQYALENGADVMTMSFSIPGKGNERGAYRLISEQAVCAGLVLVSGAGNFGAGSARQAQPLPIQLRIPEGIPCVIAAGGVDKAMKVPGFCSLGPVEWAGVRFYEDHPLPKGLIKPDVCGFPGPKYPVLKAANRGYLDPNNRIQGNSFSAPHVTGVVALMFSAAPELLAWRVKEILESTATDIEPKGKDPRTGAGLLNAYKAVQAAKKAMAEK
jgi:subtilisin family serine protease